MRGLRIGCVPYLNVAPFLAALEHGRETEIVLAHPRDLPRLWRDGGLDLCLLSTPAALRLGVEPLAGATISANGPVLSVLLLGRTAMDTWETVALDPCSITSNLLARIALERFFGRTLKYRRGLDPLRALAEKAADASVVIGDRALSSRGASDTADRALSSRGASDTADRALSSRGDLVALDLGAVWKEMTGLPFVFAVWARGKHSRRRREDLEHLLATARRASARWIDACVEERRAVLDADPRLLRTYLRRHISYRFGDEERLGLSHFHSMLLLHTGPLGDDAVSAAAEQRCGVGEER